jgi:hypothetical protein
MNFFPIPEIDLRRFSYQFSLEVIVAIYQKTSNNSRNIANARKLLAGINAKMNELSSDMNLVAEHLVFEEIISIYSMGTHEIPLVSDF